MKIKKIIKLLSLTLLTSLILINVKAKEYIESFTTSWIKNEYVIKDNGNPKDKKYQQMTLIKRKSDNHYVYCIQLGTRLKDVTYFGYDENQDTLAGLTKEEWDTIQLLAYYGYGYDNHTDIKWYVITQLMIWQTIPNGYTVYFTDTLNGNKITKYEEEMQELKDLVSKHYTKPNFNIEDITLKDTKAFIDTNNVLENYTIINASNISATINGNTLEVTPTSLDENYIQLEKKVTNDKSIVYINDNSQNIMLSGGTPTISEEITFNVKKKIQIKKVDMNTNEEIKLANISFKIKDNKNNQYICINESCTFKTDNNGYIDISLSKGNYTLEELDETINNYLWNKEKLIFTVDDNSPSVILFPNKEVKGTIKLLKYGENLIVDNNNYTYKYIPLDNVKFHLYAKENIYKNDTLIYKKDELIKEIITQEGLATITDLPLGHYYIKEVNTSSNYILDTKEYDINLEYINQYTDTVTKEITIKNTLKKGNLEILKIDKDTLEPLSNVEIEIENLYKGYTNEEGKIILNDIPTGTYIIKELATINNYVLNDEESEITIEEGKTTYITLSNEKEKTDNTNSEITEDPIEIIDVPDTFLNEYNHLLYIIIIIGVYLIYEKKL